MPFIIKKATQKDIPVLAKVSKKAFYKPHKDAIPEATIAEYMLNNFNEATLLKEITNSDFQYYLIYVDDVLAGFSKIIFNSKNQNIKESNVTKMERFYLLEEYYNLGLGKALFQFNVNLAKQNHQKGIWLYVWIKNHRAIQFYTKNGFQKIALYDFPISNTESRLNDVMYLEF
ncbi:GNAT family N-acetyltransferase [Polaribacter sp.]|uniref:GNAT family N-acetyltransferase n=1 Tax=Polaribacter sp. TaxID=1920175 RepID=UPI003F6A9588